MRATKTFFRPFLLPKRKGPKKATQNNAAARPVSRLEIIQKECPALGGTNVNAFCLFLRPEPFTPDAGPPFWAACPQEGLAGFWLRRILLSLRATAERYRLVLCAGDWQIPGPFGSVSFVYSGKEFPGCLASPKSCQRTSRARRLAPVGGVETKNPTHWPGFCFYLTN